MKMDPWSIEYFRKRLSKESSLLQRLMKTNVNFQRYVDMKYGLLYWRLISLTVQN